MSANDRKAPQPEALKGHMPPPFKKRPDFKTIERFAEAGLSDWQMAHLMRMSEGQWQSLRQNPEYEDKISDALNRGSKLAKRYVEQSLYGCAVGLVTYEKKTDQKIDRLGKLRTCVTTTTTHHPPNYAAAISWLANKFPEEWKVKRDGSEGEIVVKELMNLSTQEYSQLKDLLLKEAKRKKITSVEPEQRS